MIQSDTLDNIETNDEIRVFENELLGEFIIVPLASKIPKICIYSGSITASSLPSSISSSSTITTNLHWGLINLNEKYFQADMVYITNEHNTLYIKQKNSGHINLTEVDIFESFSINLPLDYFGMIVITDIYTRQRKQVCILSGMKFYSEMIFKCRNLFIPKETRLLKVDLLVFKKNDNIMVNLINNAV